MKNREEREALEDFIMKMEIQCYYFYLGEERPQPNGVFPGFGWNGFLNKEKKDTI